MAVLDTALARCGRWLQRARRGRIGLGLALQGGGSHGAYTWGVLDRLLEEPRIEISALSGTSAGAMNAAVCAQGLVRGGRHGAREALAEFWEAVGAAARLSPAQPGLLGHLLGDEGLEWSPTFGGLLALTRVFSPYELNPLNFNPLREIVERHVDFAALRDPASPDLFIAATRVSSGRLRVFDNDELSVEALLASACLPTLHHAVTIDGEDYWDGGYCGNPVVYPLVDLAHCGDVMLLLLSPLERQGELRSAREIVARASEISFNAAFLREMQWLARYESSGDRTLRGTRFHLLTPDAGLAERAQLTKLNADWDFLQALHAGGRAAADAWLAAHRRALGRRSTVRLAEVFGSA
ncbi:NTE family protein [Plasticicumulans lactativorans]|uniref:NTE family protein n=1 Tax=Plasticicumulans lactativorans TaxID=1133106 RepID=A0A4R2L4V8_9GAMM|nr:patatin-like phospholipase family protein [Plasticicumulans lactativorans]TCO82331.1 NTE family protein [Plasticicumulans lactativorans]